MEATPENSAAKVKGPEIEKSSIPSTPAKLGVVEAQSIYPEKQEQQSLQANWSQQSLPYEGNALDEWGKRGKSIKFEQEIEVRNAATCCGESNSVTVTRYSGNSEATSAAESQLQEDALRIYHEFSLENADKWSNVSFQELIALADAAGTAKAAEETSKTTALIAESMSYGIQFTQLQAKSTSFSLENQGLDSSNQNIPETPNRGSAISSRLCFDLNSPPRTMADASSARISCQFAPVTPDLLKRTEREKMFDSATAKEKTIQNEVTVMAESDELQNNHSELIENQSSATISIVIGENFKPEIGSYQQTDMSTTPQQKPRRRKHRPKVIVEGQIKRTRNRRTPKPAGNGEIATPKRKYIRKNIVSKPVDTHLEAKTSGTDVEVKPPSSEELPKTKRKYVRRQATTPTEEGHNSRTRSKSIRVTRSCCKRSLNFDFESKVPDERSTQPPKDVDANSHPQVSIPQDQSRSAMKVEQDKEAMIEKNEVYIACDLMQTMNHEFEQYLLDKESQTTGNSTCITSNELHDNLMVGNQNERIIGKCQIVFSDVTHDKETSIFRTMTSNARCATRSSSNSNCSSRTCLPQETQSRGSKRQQSSTTDELESCRINVTGAHYNSLQAYQELFPTHGYDSERTPSMHFPAIFKKKRTENLHKLATSSILPTSSATDYGRDSLYPSNDPHRKVFTSGNDLGISTTHCNASSNSTAAAANGTQHEQNTLMCLPNLGSAERSTKKRSKCPTRVRNFASLHEICRQFPTSSKGKLTSEDIQGPPTCMDALVANTRARLTTKKRSKRNSVASAFPYSYNHHQFATTPMGSASLMSNNKSPIDAIIEQFNCLDIEREHNKFANQEQNELVPYQVDYPWHNSIVVYQRNGAVIPFDSSFTQIRKRRPRPKVDLDDETNRVWKLLLEDINNDGIDGTDQEKAQWWEDEREVFRGRANSFIARMHLVQGDRRFTPWKGSVVDSVIGVFLTQNVSDHLSSSAYMSMAARFPLKSGSHQNDTQSCDQRTTEGPEVLNPDDTIEWHKVSSQLSSLQDSMTLCDKKYNVEEVINTRHFSGNTSEDIKATKYSTSLSSDSSECSPKLYNELDVNRLNSRDNEIRTSFIGDQREFDDVISSQNSVISPHDSVDSNDQTANKAESYSQSSSEAEPADGSWGSFVKLLQMAGTTMLHGVYNEGNRKRSSGINMATKPESTACNSQSVNSGYEEFRDADPSEDSRFCDICKDKEVSVTEQSGLSAESSAGASCQTIIAISFEEVRKLSSENLNSPNNHRSLVEDQETELGSKVQKQENNCRVEQVSNTPSSSECILDVSGRTHLKRNQKTVETNLANCHNLVETVDEMSHRTSKAKSGRNGKEKKEEVDWDSLRIQTLSGGIKREGTADTMDSVDWEAVRLADVGEIAHTIKERGMNNMLAERIKDFLNRLVRDHGNIDLEWLRDVPPDRAKEYLLSVRGLGLKSVECVRLLTLHHLAFPVDTNVGRIAVRLGWVPLQPLPESLQLHLLELYPVLESIQKFLWPRLCKLDQRTLYELHYQMITFGKVFCTKSKPNCNSCPMRGECRHFASAFASARLALPAPEEKSIISATVNKTANRNPAANINHLKLPPSEAHQQLEAGSQCGRYGPIIEEPTTPEPIIEEPASPEPQQREIPEMDIEDTFHDVDEIPTIKLNIEEFNQNLQNYIQKNVALTSESEMSKALVVLTPESASIPTTKLKNINRLRTEHHVYELPDAHPLLEGFDRREPDDPSSYLLAIWTPGETVNSIQPPERRCSFQESGKLCDQETCFSCNSIREANSQTIRGTLLIPCRTAMRGSFPLNGTYFQVNEVFADHESSLNPIDVPRDWLWNLRRRTVYFGTSIPTIFKGLSQGEIQYCFWRGFVCVRGFDRKTRAPRPLVARLHFPASKVTRTRGRTDES